MGRNVHVSSKEMRIFSNAGYMPILVRPRDRIKVIFISS